MFETQKSRNKTSSGDIGLNIRILASVKVGQDQVSGGESVPCRHATPVADALWKPMYMLAVNEAIRLIIYDTIPYFLEFVAKGEYNKTKNHHFCVLFCLNIIYCRISLSQQFIEAS